MQPLTAAALLMALSTAPAAACSIALGTDGAFALSADATSYATTESGGHGATLTIVNLDLSNATFTVSAPSWVTYAGGFNVGSAQLAVAYAGGGLLNAVTQNYTTAQTSFNVPALLSVAAILTIQNKITSSTGFPSGTYQTRVTVTCS